MSLKLYNVASHEVEPFAPLDPDGKKVRMYVCGLTVYDHAHLGHARTQVGFEVIRNWLERRYDLKFVQNVTDVEDKIINRAAELGVSPREHSAKWDKACLDAMRRLGVKDADELPHVTDSIEDIIAFVQTIIDNGFAYTTDEGNVYFDVPAYDAYAREHWPDAAYGHLSRRDYQEMAAGTRKEVAADKRHPADFALWKAAKGDEHPDANWESPWGEGRPGWHIECSLMSTRSLGHPIDIHGGGQDLIFPHHENEIAQSQAHFKEAPFVRYWMHTGFLNVEGQKMSKSLGNFIVLTELLDELDQDGIDPAALRFYFTQTHYRSKIDFSREGLATAARGLERLERTRRLVAQVVETGRLGCADIDPPLQQATASFRDDFTAAMDDDINTPEAIAALFAFQKQVHKALDAGGPEGELGSGAAKEALSALEEMGQVLTLFQEPVEAGGRDAPAPVLALAGELGVNGTEQESEVLDGILAAREKARQEKDWATADKVRDTLHEAGYVIHDTPQGARWERA